MVSCFSHGKTFYFVQKLTECVVLKKMYFLAKMFYIQFLILASTNSAGKKNVFVQPNQFLYPYSNQSMWVFYIL